MATKKQAEKIEEIKKEEVKETIKEVEVKDEKAKRRNIRDLITKDTEVLVMNNCRGEFTYDCPRTAQRFNMTKFGDTDVMTVEQLNAMKNQHRTILDQYWILPLEVYADDITIEDIFQYLRISELYKDLEISQNAFDNLLLFSDIEKFEKNINEMSKDLVSRLAERAVILFENNKFYDSRKQEILKEKIKDEFLFSKEY